MTSFRRTRNCTVGYNLLCNTLTGTCIYKTISDLVSKLVGLVTGMKEQVNDLSRKVTCLQANKEPSPPLRVTDKFYPCHSDVEEFRTFCTSLEDDEETRERLVSPQDVDMNSFTLCFNFS